MRQAPTRPTPERTRVDFLFNSHYVSGLLFFFFQAEDGIRDYKVTGVQTCALPIFVTERCRLDFIRPGFDNRTRKRNSINQKLAHLPISKDFRASSLIAFMDCTLDRKSVV